MPNWVANLKTDNILFNKRYIDRLKEDAEVTKLINLLIEQFNQLIAAQSNSKKRTKLLNKKMVRNSLG